MNCVCVIKNRNIFFFNDTATTEIYTLSLHDALPISTRLRRGGAGVEQGWSMRWLPSALEGADIHRFSTSDQDRKSTRLNSSHANISYAVFCLKKKKNKSYSGGTRDTNVNSDSSDLYE